MRPRGQAPAPPPKPAALKTRVSVGAKQDRRGRKGRVFSRYGSAVIGLCNSCKRQLCSGCSGRVSGLKNQVERPSAIISARRGSEVSGNSSHHFIFPIGWDLPDRGEFSQTAERLLTAARSRGGSCENRRGGRLVPAK